MYNRKRYAEKVQMKKKIKMHEKRETKNKKEEVVPEGAVPAYLLDRWACALSVITIGFMIILFYLERDSPGQKCSVT